MAVWYRDPLQAPGPLFPAAQAAHNASHPLLCHVPHWFSPFPLAEGVVAQLEQAGLEPVTVLLVEQQEPLLLLYDTPDRLFASTDLNGPALLDGYRSLLAAPATSPRLSVWRLADLDAEQLGKILSGDPPPERSAERPPPDPEPLAALVTGALCRSVPGLLDAYLDLELQSLLGGGEPDSAYLRRLQSRLSSEGLLQAWRSPGTLAKQKLEQLDTALKEEREEAELTLLQLHQVQKELEHCLLQSRSSDQLLAAQAEALQQAEVTGQEQLAKLLALEAEAGQLRRARDEAAQDRELQGRSVADLQKQLSSKAEALTEAREEAELTLLQLHQVQEELEHYFLHSRSSDQLAEAQAEQNRRAFSLIGRMVRLYIAPA